MKLPTLLSLAFFFSMVAVSAEMVFKTKLVEITVKPGQKVVTGIFPFEIKDGPVTVVNYDAKCSCLAARLEPLKPDRSVKLHWKAGEKGTVMTQFDTSKFLGTVEKAVELNLKGQKESTILTVRIHVPELVKMEPSSLRWDKGGKAEEKVMKITMHHDQPIKIIKDMGNNEKIFPYKLVTIKEGWEYEIRIKPSDVSQSGMGMISLTTDSKFPRFKRAAAYAVIRPEVKTAPLLTQ